MLQQDTVPDNQQLWHHGVTINLNVNETGSRIFHIITEVSIICINSTSLSVFHNNSAL